MTSIDVSDHEILVGCADGRARRYDLRNGQLLTDFVGAQGCNSKDTLNFGHKTWRQTGPHSGPNSVLGHYKFRHVSKLLT